MAVMYWHSIEHMNERRWTCGHCGEKVAANLGYYKNDKGQGDSVTVNNMAQVAERIVICPGCERPTYFNGDTQFPGVVYGKPVLHLPPDLNDVYTQARNCMAVGGYVPVVLAARTILMHVAVEQGAKEGETFAFYVDHLVQGGFVPPNSKSWVDQVRVKGNAATHKVTLMSREDAEKVLRFVEMILLILYEYPNAA